MADTDIIKEALEDAQGIIRCDREKAHDAEKPLYDEFGGQCQAALTAYEALKKRVEELEDLRELAESRARAIWSAIQTNQVIDKDAEGQAKRLYELLRAATLNKEGE